MFFFRHSYHAWPGIVLSIFLPSGFKEGRDRCDCLSASVELVGQPAHGSRVGRHTNEEDGTLKEK